MEKSEILAELNMSENSLRRWCKALDIPFGATFTAEQVDLFHQLKEKMANRVGFDDAIAQITGHRPEPKPAPGRYSNLPGQLQPKTVATAMVQQFDQDVMTEFFKLLSQPMTRQEIAQYMDVIGSSDDVVDVSYLLEAGSDD